jgi:16S rRNA A1518/A1519 N6-dimethyltransferase RsmA/KsgA/DIM1 with predicted DNA glycosylase/AP lyase activity
MTLTDVENYEQALADLEDALTAEEYDRNLIEQLNKKIKHYEDIIYEE